MTAPTGIMTGMAYTPIMGTLVYVLDEERRNVLLVHRNKRADDQHFGKWNGLGGKLESSENLAACARREVEEEAGISVVEMHLRGTVSWPGFGSNGEDWFSPIFLVTEYVVSSPSGRITVSNHEGDLHWIEVSRLLEACHEDEAIRRRADLDLWEGDRFFLPMVFDDDPRPFHGVMPYENGRPTSWTVERW